MNSRYDDDDGVCLSMNINRMMSHDDMDDDYMCVGLPKTSYHPDDDMEPYFEDEEGEQEGEDDHLYELNPNHRPTGTLTTENAMWSIGSVTNYEPHKKSQRKSSYLKIDQRIIESISSEFYQLIQHVDDSTLGIFGRVRLSGSLLTSSSRESTPSAASAEGNTPPSLSLVREILTLLIDHNLIEYEVLVCYLIYSRRLCGFNPLSMTSSPSQFASSTSSSSLNVTPTMSPLPITQHNWKGILLGLLCLTTKLWDDYSLINKDFIEPLLSQHQTSSTPLISASGSLLQFLNHYELQLIKQFNYSFFITEMEYNSLHELITARAQHITVGPPPRPSTSSRIPSSSSLLLSPSSPRPSSSHGPSAATPGSSLPSSSSTPSSPPSNLSRQISRSWSWKLKNNRIAVSTEDEGN